MRGLLQPNDFQKYQLENLIEMNRFWCRTAYDPARTKSEEKRRDEKRRYLGEIIQTNFLELAKSSVKSSSGAVMFEKIME